MYWINLIESEMLIVYYLFSIICIVLISYQNIFDQMKSIFCTVQILTEDKLLLKKKRNDLYFFFFFFYSQDDFGKILSENRKIKKKTL